MLEVLVVDDRLSVRRGTELLLREAGLRVVGAVGDTDEARALVARRRHDVVVLEPCARRGDDALVLARELRDGPLVLYTDGPGMAAAAAVRAPGFVPKSAPPHVLIEAVRRVAGGGRFSDEQFAERTPGKAARLSPREREILGLLADGLTGAEIARQLFLSSETVRTHVRNATQKLGARTRTQAVAIAVRQEYS